MISVDLFPRLSEIMTNVFRQLVMRENIMAAGWFIATFGLH